MRTFLTRIRLGVYVVVALLMQLAARAQSIPPTITIQPQSATTMVGSSVSFMVTATGSPSIGYQWRKNGTNILTATNPTLTFPSVGSSDAGNYDVVVMNAYGTVTSSVAIMTLTPGYAFSTLAGQTGQTGSADGAGASAQFNQPYGIGVDSAGNVYVSDSQNNTIRKITPVGGVTTLAGLAGQRGSVDGIGVSARFYSPAGIAVDSAGNVFVADSGNYTIRKISPSGVVTTIAGTAGNQGRGDGVGSAAQFYFPGFVTVDSSGNVYVSESNSNVVRKITPAGVVTTLTLTGSNLSVTGLTIDGAGNLYVVEASPSVIVKLTPAGAITTFANMNRGIPTGLAVDSKGNLYFADYSLNTINEVTASGTLIKLAGIDSQAGSGDGIAGQVKFNHPYGVAVDSSGNLYVTDSANQTIRFGFTVPAITSAATAATTLGQVFTFTIAATNSPTSFGATGLPPGLSIAGGIISGTPTQPGSYNVTLSATNGAGTATSALLLTVSASNQVVAWRGYLIGEPSLLTTATNGLILGTATSPPTRPAELTSTSVLTTIPGNTGVTAQSGSIQDIAGNFYQIYRVTDTSVGGSSIFISKTAPTGSSVYLPLSLGAFASTALSFTESQSAFYVTAVGNPSSPVFRLSSGLSSSQVVARPRSDIIAGLDNSPITIDANDNITYPVGYTVVVPENGTIFHRIDYITKYVYAAVGPVPYIDRPILAYIDWPFPQYPPVGTQPSRFIGVPLSASPTVSLSVNAISSLPISYQWSYNGVSIIGANQATYNGVVSSSGSYSVVASTSGGTVSSAAQVQLTVAGTPVSSVPTFISNPLGATILPGSSINLTATAGATLPVTFQWYLDGAPIAGANSSIASVANYGAFTTGFSANQPGTYTVVASTSGLGFGSATSSAAIVKVQTADGTNVLPTPTIITQPIASTANYANNAVVPVSLSVVAAATLPLSYQWYLNGTTIAGATAAAFGAMAPGAYTVAVSTTAGSVTSNSVNVTVKTSSGVLVVASPTILAGPNGASLAFGRSQSLPVLSVSAVALQPMSFQWFINGTAIPGATTSTYATTNTGSYTVVVTTSGGSVTTEPAVVTVANRLANISARAQVGSGASATIAGFVVSSYATTGKQVLIRAVGPSLSQFGVSGILAHPALSVFDSAGRRVASNAGWNNAADVTAADTAVGAFPLQVGSADAALTLSLATGAYTAVVSSANNSAGVALIEVYEITDDASQFINISDRAMVGTGGNILIGGLVVGGTQPGKVLIRAAGPGLAQFGVAGVLAQPVLSVYNSNGQLIAANTGWTNGSSADAVAIDAARSSVGAFAFQPGSTDCAVLLTLSPGAYTAQVSGANGTTGIALVELYQVPQ